MFSFLKNNTYPVGIDIRNDAVRVAQLKEERGGLVLISAAGEECPSHIQPGSSDWQKWVIETLQLLASKHKFLNNDIIASIPASDVFIDHVKMPKSEGKNLDDAILSKVKQKLPFSPDQALVKYITGEDDNFVVIATEREKINRHLAIYEKANLRIKTLGVWPLALTNSYSRFFGRRQSDLKSIVMLIEQILLFADTRICCSPAQFA
jgi:Tfp pilus assembly PilM family ATPase